MTDHKRVYLAGPEVFFPEQEHARIVATKKAILNQYGFAGVDPLDTALEFSPEESKPDRGFRIFRANRELMNSCHAVIANLTPFRGLSADPGTVFEVGYMIAQGKPAFGFTTDSRDYFERAGAEPVDGHGYSVEDFELGDNLMIECGIVDSGGQVFRSRPGLSGPFDREVFERCVRALAG